MCGVDVVSVESGLGVELCRKRPRFDRQHPGRTAPEPRHEHRPQRRPGGRFLDQRSKRLKHTHIGWVVLSIEDISPGGVAHGTGPELAQQLGKLSSASWRRHLKAPLSGPGGKPVSEVPARSGGPRTQAPGTPMRGQFSRGFDRSAP